MKQKAFLWVCLCVCVLGLAVLFFLTPDISPQSMILEGEIIDVNNVGKVSFINFIPYDFTVVSFDDVNQSGSATLIGKIASYEGKLEFIVEEIR